MSYLHVNNVQYQQCQFTKSGLNENTFGDSCAGRP